MSYPPSRPLTDDTVLVGLIAAGDQAAFSAFMNNHLRAITLFASRFLSSREDGEDTAQAVFMEVWRNADQFDPSRASPKTWLFRIARNRCIDVLRRRRIRQFVGLDEEPGEVPQDAPTALQVLSDKRDLQDVANAIRALPDRQRMALLMNVVGELPVRSVAVAMETSEGAVEQLIARARRTLRLSIGRHIGNQ